MDVSNIYVLGKDNALFKNTQRTIKAIDPTDKIKVRKIYKPVDLVGTHFE